MSQDLSLLLYDYFHSFGLKERNELAARITEKLGPGVHQFGDRTIVVDEPVQETGWTRYNLSQRPPK